MVNNKIVNLGKEDIDNVLEKVYGNQEPKYYGA